MSRRGFGLVELLAALTLSAFLSVLVGRVVLRAAEGLRGRSERIAGEHALRVGAGSFRAALEAASNDAFLGPDLSGLGTSQVVTRVARAAGVLCSATPVLLVARAGPAWWSGLRNPVAGRDSIMAAHAADTSWRGFALRGAPGATLCPDGAAGITLPINPDSLGVAGLGDGSPIRVFESLELRIYSSPPDFWLGMRLTATAQPIQPFAGPLLSAGSRLSWLRLDGTVAAGASEVAVAEIGLASLTERGGGLGLVRWASGRPDSLSVFVLLPPP